jgi:hypothetical protein
MSVQPGDGGRRKASAYCGRAMLFCAGAFAACGGTTGREDLPAASNGNPVSGDATLSGEGSSSDDVEAGDESASNDSAGDFDAGIQYADASRLNGFDATVGSQPSGNGEGGSQEAGPGADWPVCAQDSIAFIQRDGSVVTDFGDATPIGRAVEIPDDSGACATHMWTTTFSPGADAGNETCDQCLRKAGCGNSSMYGGDDQIFPPCNDLRSTGTASQGPLAGTSLFTLCASLFDCVSQHSCAGDGPSDPNSAVTNCYCGTNLGSACFGDGSANGICKSQIEAADQVTPSTSVAVLLQNLTDLTNPGGFPSRTGAEVLSLYNCALQNDCSVCFAHSGGDGG